MPIVSGSIHRLAPPKEIVKHLTEYGGLTPTGVPKYRLSWANSRLAIKEGKWEDRDSDGVILRTFIGPRRVPKYPQALGRFVIEVWQPPEYYGTPDEWRRTTREVIDGQTVNILGDYPQNGDYEWLDTVEGASCECGKTAIGICEHCHTATHYIEPTRAYVEYVVDAHRFLTNCTEEVIAKSEARRKAKEIATRNDYLDMIRDNAPAHAGLPNVALPGIEWRKNG